MENYEKKYKEALAKCKAYIDDTQKRWSEEFCKATEEVFFEIFHELKESEDEKMLRVLREGFSVLDKNEEWYDGVTVGQILAWLEKQGEQKEYTFKSLPRLLDMIEPTERAKAYCRKLMDTLVNEGYATDAKIVGECLKQMNGEKVAFATMDNQKINKSEDEKTRKAILNYLTIMWGNSQDDICGVHVEDAIAWLEKQGEQKPIDKVELNFHEGDWIVYKNEVCQIVKREEGCNKLVTVFGIEKELVNERNLSTARLWTIQDAKDSDVLYSLDSNQVKT